MDECDNLTAGRACNRDVHPARQSAKQTCSDVVNISIFFDGTGNNKDVDESKKRWSNPARLYRAAELLVKKGMPNHAIYVSGVGTPFNGTATDWMDESLMKLEDSISGGLAGGGGTRRTEFGQSNVNDYLRVALAQNAMKLNLSMKPYIEETRLRNLHGLAAALEEHGMITVVNLSIFGFSRGAALARAFSNEILKKCVSGSDGTIRYNGVRLRIHFMGLFDTVASFGVPSLNTDTPFSEKNLIVPEQVEQCVHYVAGHELRFSFPVDLIRRGGVLRTGWVETVYPGVHSDVGGGYEPTCQGITNNYARIPMRDMMREAARCGVRLVTYDDIQKIAGEMFKERFAIKPEVEAAYRQYMATIGSPTTVEDAMKVHMQALYSAWGTMTRRKIKTPDLIEAEGRTGVKKGIGHPGIAREAELLLDRKKAAAYIATHATLQASPEILQVEGMKYSMIIRPEKWRLDAWQATAPEPVLNFIRTCIHDSKAGFILSAEPFSYFRPRGMAESSRNVLARGLDWLDDTATAIKNGVIKVYHRAVGLVVETWVEGKLVATRTYPVGEKFVVDTVHAGVKYTVEIYEGTKDVIITAIERGEKMVISSINTATREVNDLAKSAQKSAGEVGHQMRTGAAYLGEAISQAAHDEWHAAQALLGY